MPHLAIQAARSLRASSTDRLSVMPAQFLQAVVIGPGRQVVEGVAEEVQPSRKSFQDERLSRLAISSAGIWWRPSQSTPMAGD